jgi:hypothetical protein
MKRLQRHGTLNTWKDSLLSKLLKSDELKQRLDGIWLKANEAYPRATWPGWIDHGVHHVLAVLHSLERLIPDYVYRDIGEPEAFTLVASVLLHDIGMIPEDADSHGDSYGRIRPTHGKRGADIIRSHFADFLQPFEYS